MAAGIQQLKQVPQLSEGGPRCGKIPGGYRYTHQTPQPEPRQISDHVGKRRQSLRCDAVPGGFRAHIHFDAHVERRQRFRSPFGKAPGDALSVHGVYPSEALRHRPGLVGLQGADEMPDECPLRRQGVELGQRLLEVVFAKFQLPAGLCRGDSRGRPRFAHRHQADTGRVAAGACGGLGDAHPHIGHIPGDLFQGCVGHA